MIESFKAIFFNPDERALYLIMTLIFITQGYSRVFLSLQLTTIEDINLVSIIFYVLEAIIFIVQAFFADKKSGRRSSLTVLYGIGFVSLVVTLIMTFTNNKYYRNILVLLVVRLSLETANRLSQTLGSEIYSRDVASFAWGSNIFISRFLSIFAGYIIISFSQVGIVIAIVFYLFSFIFSFFLQETSQKSIHNTIDKKYEVIKEDEDKKK